MLPSSGYERDNFMFINFLLNKQIYETYLLRGGGGGGK